MNETINAEQILEIMLARLLDKLLEVTQDAENSVVMTEIRRLKERVAQLEDADGGQKTGIDVPEVRAEPDVPKPDPIVRAYPACNCKEKYDPKTNKFILKRASGCPVHNPVGCLCGPEVNNPNNYFPIINPDCPVHGFRRSPRPDRGLPGQAFRGASRATAEEKFEGGWSGL